MTTIPCSEAKPFGAGLFYLVEQFGEKGIELRAVPVDHQRTEENLSEVPVEVLGDRLSGWRRKCGNPHCARGFETLAYNGEELTELRGQTQAIDEMVRSLVDGMGDHILVEGGHYIPELRNMDLMPQQPLHALEESLKIIEYAHEQGKSADLLLFVNDLHMGIKEYGSENREDFFEDYALPSAVKGRLLDLSQKGVSFRVMVVGERKLYDRLSRERKRLMRDGRLHDAGDGSYNVTVDEKEITVLCHGQENPESGRIKCRGACARVMQMAEDMEYTGLVQVYPVCALGVMEEAHKLYRHLYDEDIPTLELYRTITCFADTDKIRAIEPK